jgi:hypothetical protein
MRRRRTLLNFAQENVWLLTLLGIAVIWGGVWAADTAVRTWNVHGLALSEQARIQGEVPWGSNAYMSLIGARAGSSSVTSEYVVTEQLGNLSAFEKRVRASACAMNEANIKKGLSYIYEYHTPSGRDIAQFNVSSCP